MSQAARHSSFAAQVGLLLLLPPCAFSLSSAPAADPARLEPSPEEVQAFVAQLAAEARANVTAEAEFLEAAKDARLDAVLEKQLEAFGGAASRENQFVLNRSRKMMEEMREHEKGLEDAVQYVALKHGIEAAVNATSKEVERRLRGKHLNTSSQQILKALRGTERAWKEARDATEKAAAQAFSEWNSSINGLNTSYRDIVAGFENLNDAGEAVARAGRAIHWDKEASRFAASLAESTYVKSLETDADVQLAEEQSGQAERLTNWFAGGAVDKLESAVKSAEEEADAATADANRVR